MGYVHEGPRLFSTSVPGVLVDESDPRALTLVIAPRQELSDQQADELGVTAYMEEYQEKQAKAKRANKSAKPAAENKAAAGSDEKPAGDEDAPKE